MKNARGSFRVLFPRKEARIDSRWLLRALLVVYYLHDGAPFSSAEVSIRGACFREVFGLYRLLQASADDNTLEMTLK